MYRLLRRTITFLLFSLFISLSLTVNAGTRPGRITKLTVKTNKGSSVLLKWKKPANATQYRVYYSRKEHGPYIRATQSLYVRGKSCRLTFLNGKRYFFKVRPYHGKTKGTLSDPVSCFVGNPKKNATKLH